VNTHPISDSEFQKRLAQLCLTSSSPEMPRRQRDRQIVLKSVALCLAKERTYTEQEINAALGDWAAEVGHSLAVDHVTLRRCLIDERYIERSDDGSLYWVSVPFSAGGFAPEVEEIDPRQVIHQAIDEARAKRARYQKRRDDGS
jgi:hypothetical protein